MLKCECCGQELPKTKVYESLPEEFYIVVRRKKIGFSGNLPGHLRTFEVLPYVYPKREDAERPYGGIVFKVSSEGGE